MLLPTNIVEIKLLGERKKRFKMREVILPFSSKRKRSLSTDTNAISIPEKNAEKSIDKNKYKNIIGSINTILPVRLSAYLLEQD